jgi:hypothetical protein
MSKLLRILLVLYIAAVAYYFAHWFIRDSFSLFLSEAIAVIVSLAIGWHLWRYTSKIISEKGLVSSIVYGAIILGAIGFLVSFVWPVISSSGVIQAPVVGLLFVTPISAITGGVLGVYLWAYRQRGIERNDVAT